MRLEPHDKRARAVFSRLVLEAATSGLYPRIAGCFEDADRP